MNRLPAPEVFAADPASTCDLPPTAVPDILAESSQNIYIVGAVATGKTTLAQQLEQQLPDTYAIDTEKLFRIITKHVLDNSGINDTLLQAAQSGSAAASAELAQTASRRWSVIRERLNSLALVGQEDKHLLVQDGEPADALLFDPRIELAVAHIAQIPQLRHTARKWIYNTAQRQGRLVLTGHNLTETDATIHTILPLTVSPDIAVARSRSLPAFAGKSDETIMEVVTARNNREGVPGMLRTVDYLGIVPINTDHRNVSDVRLAAFHSLADSLRRKRSRVSKPAEQTVPREQFSWETSRIVSEVRTAAADVYREVAAQHAGVTEFDVAIQTMIHLCGRDPAEVWLGDPEVLGAVIDLSDQDATKANILFGEALAQERLYLNKDLTRSEAGVHAVRLERLIAENDAFDLAKCNDATRSPFSHPTPELTAKGRTVFQNEAGNTVLQIYEKYTGKTIHIQRIDGELSAAYARSLHYLHTPRADELAAFAAFVEGSEVPFAWASYSPIDRIYKKEMLGEIGAEPHCMLELTRAWNCPWAPKNTMSKLFSFAHSELQRTWKTDAPYQGRALAGILTAINPNLGFQAHGFKGAGFDVIGLKPATFTYMRRSDGALAYMPRRIIASKLGVKDEALATHPAFIRSKFPLLSTYEMAVFFKATDRYNYTGPIRHISNQAYSSPSWQTKP